MPYSPFVNKNALSTFVSIPCARDVRLLMWCTFSAMKINGHSANIVVCGSRKRRVTDNSILNTRSSRVAPSLRLSYLGMDVWLRCSALSIVVVELGLFCRLLSGGGGSARTRLTQNNLPDRGKWS